ncbi:hypothetical protein Msip34_2196 [Methylovorus glucosotrophus SIP3-4]|uniref:Uncharacterized protein n=1 Tax=Methylovorus glucosotrophus (strain SIP3-4) TaxID=582744 RepID=C6X7H3_METGS|nr:hypothetical protein Msip34_2196 [Methylovorus glucosotrophus SIP3-4]
MRNWVFGCSLKIRHYMRHNGPRNEKRLAEASLLFGLSVNSMRSQMVLDWTNDHSVLDAF